MTFNQNSKTCQSTTTQNLFPTSSQNVSHSLPCKTSLLKKFIPIKKLARLSGKVPLDPESWSARIIRAKKAGRHRQEQFFDVLAHSPKFLSCVGHKIETMDEMENSVDIRALEELVEEGKITPQEYKYLLGDEEIKLSASIKRKLQNRASAHQKRARERFRDETKDRWICKLLHYSSTLAHHILKNDKWHLNCEFEDVNSIEIGSELLERDFSSCPVDVAPVASFPVSQPKSPPLSPHLVNKLPRKTTLSTPKEENLLETNDFIQEKSDLTFKHQMMTYPSIPQQFSVNMQFSPPSSPTKFPKMSHLNESNDIHDLNSLFYSDLSQYNGRFGHFDSLSLDWNYVKPETSNTCTKNFYL